MTHTIPKPALTVLSGAGISQESGLDTFRSSNGLWANYAIEEVATIEAFAKNPKKVLDFFNQRRRDVLKAEPNYAHKRLAELEKSFDVTIITQNVDNLHERAGSKNVIHVHGNIFETASSIDRNIIHEDFGDIEVGTVARDGSQARPNVVLFGENIFNTLEIMRSIHDCSIFLIVGTSLQVYPISAFATLARKTARKFIIDPAPSADPEQFHIIPKTACNGIDDFIKAIS